MLLDLVKHLLRTTAFHEGLGLFTASSPIIPSLHRLKPSIFCNFLNHYLYSYMLFDLVQPFLRAALSLELAEISIH